MDGEPVGPRGKELGESLSSRLSSLRGETRTSSAASLVAPWPRDDSRRAQSESVCGEALGRRGKGKGEGLIPEANFGRGD